MEGWTRVAALHEIPPGKMHVVRVEKDDVVLYNVDGRVFASRDFCPHAGYPLSKSMFRGKYVRCALHSWEFDVTNGEYTSVPSIRMKCYGVKVEGDEVWVTREPLAPPPPKPPPSRDDA